MKLRTQNPASQTEYQNDSNNRQFEDSNIEDSGIDNEFEDTLEDTQEDTDDDRPIDGNTANNAWGVEYNYAY